MEYDSGLHEGNFLGKDDWAAAARIASACGTFSPDDDDEQVAEEAQSCYNCRYRRWTAASFYCCRKGTRDYLGSMTE